MVTLNFKILSLFFVFSVEVLHQEISFFFVNYFPFFFSFLLDSCALKLSIDFTHFLSSFSLEFIHKIIELLFTLEFVFSLVLLVYHLNQFFLLFFLTIWVSGLVCFQVYFNHLPLLQDFKAVSCIQVPITYQTSLLIFLYHFFKVHFL